MLDRLALKLVKPAVDAAARWLAARGITADQVTLAGFALGMLAAGLVASGHSLLALVPLLANRALDGIDGALARLSTSSERGAFLDISLDFVFYAAIPLAFGIAAPGENALAAAVLLAAFVVTGTSFLAFAVLAEKRGLKSTDYPSKAFYYLGGLTEGTETIACFLAMCVWPEHFAVLAYFYAALCALTAATRLHAGWKAFG
ncbi:CDP-alcohol phosphatidyltransferase family protein [Aestuariivirga litoralis]|uniref:CDP-alcohol phosphatidyltransferase family protein n=1 Tax=Aestuariivirga litoralis TaxID=2650924 RepID=A0A2W2ASD4_9HYPH|nr:CDP-alcohol phosphatidyltransferase family protein [Aestuariivirga litoralis]PZF76552.1 CDP-alcohol phosphatidyltransferase family protein [Aestuariivirga litoralis]